MVKASSMLYAVYVCLIVAILCCALLYMANLYRSLNLFYNIREDMYIENQSSVNYWLGSRNSNEVIDEEEGVQTFFKVKKHGVLEVLIAQTTCKSDTVTSIQFVGSSFPRRGTIYVSNFSNPLSFAGDVTLIGEKKIPSKNLEEKFISGKQNKLRNLGKIEVSTDVLPEINPAFRKISLGQNRVSFHSLKQKEGGLYFNSFLEETITVTLDNNLLNDVNIKGNFIITQPDSICIRSTSKLEDVIIVAPKVIIEKGFKGSIQVYADEQIRVAEQTTLSYPSVICVISEKNNKGEIIIGEKSTIFGAVIVFGNMIQTSEDNTIYLTKKSTIIGDVYCSGKLMMGGKIFGSVYSNWIFGQTQSGKYENCFIDTEVNGNRLPSYFVGIPLFKNKEATYEIAKFGY